MQLVDIGRDARALHRSVKVSANTPGNYSVAGLRKCGER